MSATAETAEKNSSDPVLYPEPVKARPKSHMGSLNGAILEAADAAKAQMKKLTALLPLQPGRWQDTLSGAAMGAAGAASAVGLGALAFYAYHTLGAEPSLIVHAQTIEGLGKHGREHIEAAVRGLGQIDAFMSNLYASSSKPTMGDFFDQLSRSGVDPQRFKSAVADHASLLGVQHSADWAQRLTDASTPLTASLHARINELVWYHDKQVAIRSENAKDAALFAQSGFAVAVASASALLASSAQRLQPFVAHMRSVTRRVVVDCGLIDDMSDRQARKSIKETSFCAPEARSRLAVEYAERQTPMSRFLMLHWLEAARAAHRPAMLQLLSLEPRMGARHTAVGQAVMIDHFCTEELLGLAKNTPELAPALQSLASRRGELESRGIRPKEARNALGEFFPELPNCSITDMAKQVQWLQAVQGTQGSSEQPRLETKKLSSRCP